MKKKLTVEMVKNVRVAYTHGGVFHADDVFSATLLKMINSDLIVKRVFKVPEEVDEDTIVFDIGGGLYDHHQEPREARENGVLYAAFGKLWRDLGTYFVPEEFVSKFDESFVQAIDNTDNTGEHNLLSGVISSFNPNWDDDLTTDEAFETACNFALIILTRQFAGIKSKVEAREIVDEAYKKAEDKKIVVLQRFVPAIEYIQEKYKDTEFIVFPSLRGGFNIQGIPVSKEDKTLKVPFPNEWLGKRNEELREVSGIKEIDFCHPGNFMCACQTVDAAIEAGHKAQEYNK